MRPAGQLREMNSTIRHLCVVAAALVGLCIGGAASTADTADASQAQARLAAVRARIATLTLRQEEQLKQRDSLNGRLRQSELDITAARVRLEDLRTAQRSAEKRRDGLRTQQVSVQRALDAQRAALAAQVRAAYLIGREAQLKLLLNQNDPASASRMIAWYGYIARARSSRIDEIRARVAQVQALVAEVEQATAKLAALQADTTREVSGLERARAERSAALVAVSQQLSSGNQQLEQLKREEQAVESLVVDLARLMQDFPVESQQSFDELRGRLPWPVPGRITAHFQEARENAAAGSRWNGVQIESTRGAKVRAAYFGRVIYADWLQGLGLLLIIGHSGNYMTLYGHAEVLYKSVGDWVSPGDVIAALSDGAGAAPQLYFEIRDGRKVIDPKLWLKAAP